MFRNIDVGREGGTTKTAQIDLHDNVIRNAACLGKLLCLFKLDAVALSIIKAERMHLKAPALSDCQGGGGVQATTQQANRFFWGDTHFDVGITNSAPFAILSGQRCMMDFCFV